MHIFIIQLACFIGVVTSEPNNQGGGILINGALGGTQMYDPYNEPHATGNLTFGLPTGILLGVKVICGDHFDTNCKWQNFSSFCLFSPPRTPAVHEDRDMRKTNWVKMLYVS
jgi:hypothetical protein